MPLWSMQARSFRLQPRLVKGNIIHGQVTACFPEITRPGEGLSEICRRVHQILSHVMFVLARYYWTAQMPARSRMRRDM